MKLIRKLAIEFSEEDSGDSVEQIPAYEAGFRKARDMALIEFKKYIHSMDGAFIPDDQDAMEFASKWKTVFKHLGEEEVSS